VRQFLSLCYVDPINSTGGDSFQNSMVEDASVLSFAQRHTEILQFTNFETSSPVQVVSLERFTSYKLFRVYIGGTVLVSFA